MGKYILVLLLTFVFKNCLAQFNDTTHYYVGFNSSGSINRTQDGNTYLLNNALKFSEKNKSSVLNFTNNWIYGRSNNSLTNNDFTTSLDFDLYKTFPHFFYWGLANYTTSYSLKITDQLLAGAGAAYNIIDKKNMMFNISDGFLYDKSNLLLSDSTRDIYHTYRNSFRILFRFVIKDIVVIDGSDFLQNSLQYKNDYIFRSTTNLSLKLRKWLSLTTSLNYNRMNRTQSETTLFTYGLTAEKYF